MRQMTDSAKQAMLKGRQEANQRKAEAKAAGIATDRLNPFERAKADPKSLRKAINAKCWDCEGGDADPHVVWRIGNCLCEATCPLYAQRPYQNQQGSPTPASLQLGH